MTGVLIDMPMEMCVQNLAGVDTMISFCAEKHDGGFRLRLWNGVASLRNQMVSIILLSARLFIANFKTS
ncbi:hypothetical protein Hanom_Chr15g01373371 [Helianthus anomalus]